jgi:hypothetical protein
MLADGHPRELPRAVERPLADHRVLVADACDVNPVCDGVPQQAEIERVARAS